MILADYGRRCSVPFFRLQFLLLLAPLVYAGKGYVGREVCSGCHQSIGATHIHTNMARTWQGVGINKQLPANYFETHAEGPPPDIQYALKRTGEGLFYRVQVPGHPAQEFPVEGMVGGDRHGISFLFRVPAVEGL